MEKNLKIALESYYNCLKMLCKSEKNGNLSWSTEQDLIEICILICHVSNKI